MAVIEDRKARARSWFERLRDDICSAFEARRRRARIALSRRCRGASSAVPGTAPTIPASRAAAA